MGQRKSFFLHALAAAAAVFLAACTPRIDSFTDPASSAGFLRMRGNRLSGGISTVELNAQRFVKASATSYSLAVVYRGPGRLGIGPGATLALTVDDEVVELDGRGSGDACIVISPGVVEETAYYHNVDLSLIERIAAAREVGVEVRGKDTTLRRHFTRRNFEAFLDFVARVKAAGPPPAPPADP